MSRVRREPGSNRRFFILAAVLVILFLLIFASARGKYQFPFSERIAATVFAPLQSVTNAASERVRHIGASVWEIATIYEQNQMLKSEVEQLREMQVRTNEIQAENLRLRNLLDYKQVTKQFDLIAATVIARDPGNWTDTITINCGTNDGVQKDMAVVTKQGLVGNVAAVFPSSARVQLVLDPRSSVGGLVQRPESRVAGIVEGFSGAVQEAHMVNIPRDADIVAGDQIVTSGFGGIYPKGILIGTVEDVANDQGGLLKYAVVKPAVDFQKIEEVAVIVRSREAPPAPLTPTPAEQKPQGGAR